VVDSSAGKQFLFEATPDAARQSFQLASLPGAHEGMPDGIFLTHAHWGHYTGLGLLGREAKGANGVEVFAMPRLRTFLEENGPWSQLVELGNIALTTVQANRSMEVSQGLKVTPFRVPHRDEFSETVGYRIEGPNRSALFIPDIDKWSKWDRSLADAVAGVDYAFLDGTFHDGAELGHRDMAEVPHPFIVESLQLMSDWPDAERDKVYFIHLNHTNPLLKPQSEDSRNVEAAGCHVARYGDRFQL
jgi:pyrroloquinoline quinone biosynthesis protein B